MLVYEECSDGRVEIKLLCGEPADDASCVLLFPFDVDEFFKVVDEREKLPRLSKMSRLSQNNKNLNVQYLKNKYSLPHLSITVE